jgi:hypothetical protein
MSTRELLEGSPYEQLRSSHLRAIREMYGRIPIEASTLRLYETGTAKRVDRNALGLRVRDELIRIRTYITGRSVAPQVFEELRRSLRSWIRPDRDRDFAQGRALETVAENLSDRMIAQLLEVVKDTWGMPHDRLINLLRNFRMEDSEPVEDYLDYRGQHTFSPTFEQSQRMQALRTAALEALRSRPTDGWPATILLLRMDYLVDANALKVRHPILFDP